MAKQDAKKLALISILVIASIGYYFAVNPCASSLSPWYPGSVACSWRGPATIEVKFTTQASFTVQGTLLKDPSCTNINGYNTAVLSTSDGAQLYFLIIDAGIHPSAPDGQLVIVTGTMVVPSLHGSGYIADIFVQNCQACFV